MSWVQACVELLLRCAVRWAKERHTAQVSGQTCEDMLPCIRLLLDSYFTKHLEEVKRLQA
jgi:hypothetical protein